MNLRRADTVEGRGLVLLQPLSPLIIMDDVFLLHQCLQAGHGALKVELRSVEGGTQSGTKGWSLSPQRIEPCGHRRKEELAQT